MRPAKPQDQLLCLVVPIGSQAPVDVASRLRAAKDRLDALFRAHGAVHYATFTLLPPSPRGTPHPSGPALALTLAVDPGSEPAQTLERLVSLDAQALQEIYAVPVVPGATVEDALRRVVLDPSNLQALTGGFVGTRDRNVAQIVAEGRLARHLRRAAAGKPADVREDARRLAAELSAEAFADPHFSWARQPAPQRAWRGKVTPVWLRLGASAGWLVGVGAFVLLVSTLAMIGFGNKLAVAALNASWIGISDPRKLLTLHQVYVEGGLVGIWLRGLALALLLLNAAVVILVRQRQLPLVALEFVLVLTALVGLVVLPGVAWAAIRDLGADVPSELYFAKAHLTYGTWVVMGLVALAGIVAAASLFAVAIVPPYAGTRWLVLAWLGAFLVGLAVLHFVLAGLVVLSHRFQWLGKQWYQPGNAWGYQPIDRIAVVVVGVALLFHGAFRFLLLVLKWFGDELERLNLPTPDPRRDANRRLHQTAPSITACEAEWIDRTPVMISLTEVRRPYWLFAGMARFFLWMIGSLGWHFYSEGRLGNVSTIHYAHWHLVDRGRRLLFCSNYDGDFGGYLDAFILGRVPLLNVIWRWTRLGVRPGLGLGGPAFDAAPTRELEFPKTRLWLFAGCRREQQFKAYARESMVPFQYHFTAYDLPMDDILRSTLLRDALRAPRSPASDALIMRALEA